MENHYLSLCCIIKDEENIEEFILYYTILGVTKFYIYDNESKIPLKERLNSFYYNHYCTIIDFPGKGRQMEAYNHCLQNYGHLTKWLIIADGDEYILPKTTFTLKELLKDHEEKHAIGINWVFFGTSFHNNKQKGFLVDNFRRCQKNQDRHIKVIIQPAFTNYIDNPHYGNFHDPSKFMDIKNNIITGYAFNSNYTTDIIQINHYVNKSLEESINKFYRGNADNTVRVKVDESIHNFANDIIDNYLPNKYLNNIKKKQLITCINFSIYRALNNDIIFNNDEEIKNHILFFAEKENRPLHIHDKFPEFNRTEYRKQNPQFDNKDDVWVEVNYIVENTK